MKQLFLFLSFLFLLPTAFAFDDPTQGQPLLPWLWKDQFKPTIKTSFDSTGLAIFASGAAATVIAHQYDQTIYSHNEIESDRFMNKNTASQGGFLGSGGPGISIAVLQLFFDQKNGLQHSRALALTAASHITLATMIHRERPSGRDYLSFPSGHSSSSFATATSLAYSYGWKVGVPAYTAATFVALSRVNENIHWFSDVVAGAALGIYWGRASAQLDADRRSKSDLVIMPVPTEDGGALTAMWSF